MTLEYNQSFDKDSIETVSASCLQLGSLLYMKNIPQGYDIYTHLTACKRNRKTIRKLYNTGVFCSFEFTVEILKDVGFTQTVVLDGADLVITVSKDHDGEHMESIPARETIDKYMRTFLKYAGTSFSNFIKEKRTKGNNYGHLLNPKRATIMARIDFLRTMGFPVTVVVDNNALSIRVTYPDKYK